MNITRSCSLWWNRLLELTTMAFLQSLHARGPQFVTIHNRPKRVEHSTARLLDPIVGSDAPKTAIVLFGSRVRGADFTLETARFYRRFWPDVSVVLSTFDDEHPAVLEEFMRVTPDVVFVSKDQNKGAGRTHWDGRCAQAGIARARELGCSHVAVNRADQRIGSSRCFQFLHDVLTVFPIRNGGAQRARIVTTSQATLRDVSFHISNRFTFGHIDDLERYWSPPLEMADHGAPETFLALEFMKQCGREWDGSLEGYWKALGDCFCVVDDEMLDLYSRTNKGGMPFLGLEIGPTMAQRDVCFSDWLRLLHQNVPKKAIGKPLL